ncbi:UNVERIFIED_CONTAM: hypothetical protein NCL1_28066 [Trichonephila clavipes]
MRQDVQHAPRSGGALQTFPQRQTALCLRTVQQDVRSRGQLESAQGHPYCREDLRVQTVREVLQEVLHPVHSLAHTFGHQALPLPILRQEIPPEIGHEETYLYSYSNSFI